MDHWASAIRATTLFSAVSASTKTSGSFITVSSMTRVYRTPVLYGSV
jgi:hypothetical protein